MIKVTSYTDFISRLTGKERAYLLLYKRGSEKSECAFSNIQAGSRTVKDINVFHADVTNVRDIHTRYNITTVPVLMEFRKGELINIIKGCNDAGQYKALFEDKVYRIVRRNEEKKPLRVTVYSAPACSWCNTLKNYLRQHNVLYTDIDLSRDQRAADALVKRSGQTGVPQTDINGEIIVGFNKTRINELLGIKG
jgi:glutaredoxin-like YruB-family protein